LNRPHDLTGCGEPNLVGDSGDAEVGDLDLTIRGDQKVSRLHVTVNQAGLVRGI
jgi:hypothetical protein